jgi:hypothetical protein
MFGLGEGKLEIVLPKEDFKVGEKITGQVKLTLNSEKQANGVKLKLSMQKSYMMDRRMGGEGFRAGLDDRARRERMDVQTVFQKEIVLAPAGKFSGTSSYDFEFDTSELSQFVEAGAVLGMDAFLDIPLSLGFRQSKALVISR